MTESNLFNVRDTLNLLSTNANVFKAFREKYNIQVVKSEKNQDFYDLKQVVKFWVLEAKEKTNENLDKNAEETRLKSAQADLAELKLAQQRGEVLNKLDVENAISNLLSIVKSKFLNLPGNITDLITGLSDRNKVMEIVKSQVHECLNELADMAEIPNEIAKDKQISESEFKPPIEDNGPTTTTDSIPMGKQ